MMLSFRKVQCDTETASLQGMDPDVPHTLHLVVKYAEPERRVTSDPPRPTSLPRTGSIPPAQQASSSAAQATEAGPANAAPGPGPQDTEASNWLQAHNDAALSLLCSFALAGCARTSAVKTCARR